MRERLVMGLTGYSGTGKTTVAKHLADRGVVVVESSTIIRAAAAKRGLVAVPASRQEYDTAYRVEQRYRGMTWLSDSILALQGDRIMHAGLRAKPDFLNVRSRGGLIIALMCPVEICLERMDVSNPKNPRTAEEYLEHQNIENSPDENGFGSHTEWCIDHADYLVDSSRSIEDTLTEVDTIVGL